VIYRCVFNGGWVENCYGTEGLKRVGSNTVSCSGYHHHSLSLTSSPSSSYLGVTIGTRDAIVVYAHLITQQLDPRVRYGRNTTKTNQGCISLGNVIIIIIISSSSSTVKIITIIIIKVWIKDFITG